MRSKRGQASSTSSISFGFSAFFGVFAMDRIYSSTPSKLKRITLTPKTLESIGRLVRACAEIEDLITLHICDLASISETHAAVLLGRTTISKRLEIGAYFAKLTGEKAQRLFEGVFDPALTQILECRNATAHGVLLGETEDGRIAFLTAQTLDPVGSTASKVVISYRPEDIEDIAKAAESAIPTVEKWLKLSTFREKRLEQVLAPHRKGQPQPKPRKRPGSPPQSSGG
jgi:hypothetical protein